MTTVAAGQAPGAGTPAEPLAEYQRAYPGRADQARNVRRDVAENVGECPVADDAVLIACELGTNAILFCTAGHAAGISRSASCCIAIACGLNARTPGEYGEAGGTPMTAPTG